MFGEERHFLIRRDRHFRIVLPHPAQRQECRAIRLQHVPHRVVGQRMDGMAARDQRPHQRTLRWQVAGAVPGHQQDFCVARHQLLGHGKGGIAFISVGTVVMMIHLTRNLNVTDPFGFMHLRHHAA